MELFKIILIFMINVLMVNGLKLPLVINTWAFNDSTQAAWNYLKRGGDAIDAVEIGCMTCERLQCDGTVGFGGSPDENGETALDALIFDGTTMNMGAVGSIKRIKDAISVAKHVLKYTSHSLLVGSRATDFAKDMGFTEEDIGSAKSRQIWRDWKKNNCQPNSWLEVIPDCKTSCGPYKPLQENDINYDLWSKSSNEKFSQRKDVGNENHDTIGMIAIDAQGNIVAGTSTNGMIHKIPGRVGDAPLPGAGAYADSTVGAATGTGDGDVMMRFLPSFLAVEELRRGASPNQAALTAIHRIRQHYPEFFGGIVVVNREGEFGAACNGMESFPFTVANPNVGKATVMRVTCKY